MINNLVVVSDLHCGCQLGLCPPKITLAHGGVYRASKFQKYVWECWLHFWREWVPLATRGEPFAVLVNGDAVDGRYHGATHQISQNLADQGNIACEILAPVKEQCDGRFYYVSGTDAHVGPGGEDEERIAQRLSAIPDTDTGRASRHELYIKIGGALVHATHHIGITGSMAYEATALTKEYTEFCAESARWGRTPPDVLIRSHRHRHSEVRVPTQKGYGIVAVTAGWQLKTPFTFRIPGGRVSTPVIGGTLVRAGDEEHYTRHKTWETKRSTTVVPR